MRQILVPTDFSPNSEKAILVAIHLASRCGASLTLLHVFTPVESSFVETEARRKAYNNETEDILTKKLHRLGNRMLGESSVQINYQVGRSPIINCILDSSKSVNADLIIMGTKGASAVKGKMLGSNACSIVEKSKIAVLLVPHKYEIGEMKKTVFVTTCEDTDSEALQIMMTIVRAYQSTLAVIHLQTEEQRLANEQKLLERFKEYSSDLNSKLKYLGTKFKIITVSSIPLALENLHELIDYDILTMTRRHKNAVERLFLPGLIKNMALQSSHPLLVIPADF